MKKNYVIALLCIIMALLCASCASSSVEDTQSLDSNACSVAMLTSEQTTLTTTEVSHSFSFMPYPETTAVAEKDQIATDWMRSYLHKNKAAFNLIIAEILEMQNYHWGVRNSGDGFVRNPAIPDPNWVILSQDTQRSIEAIDADFRKEFGPDVSVSVGCNGVPRDDGRRAVHFSCIIFGDDWEELHRLLSYFPDGYANIRPDTPYVDFGDRWHFYSGVNL